MNATGLRSRLARLLTCPQAVDWLGDRDLAAAWAECPRADWMLWLTELVGVDPRLLAALAADIAEDVLPIFERECPDDDRPRQAIETRRRWARGEATKNEWYGARAAARDSVWAAAQSATSYAESAAVVAASAAASVVAGDVASHAASAAGGNAALARYANMVRARITVEMVEAAMNSTVASSARNPGEEEEEEDDWNT